MKRVPVLFNHNEKCNACGACKNICPVKAIQFKENLEGFIYPIINADLCMKCNNCIRVCPLKNNALPKSLQITYAACSGNTDLSQSASGGIFASIASAVLGEGGFVYGSEMLIQNGQATIRHTRIDKKTDLYLLLGSKYVYSKTGLTFSQAEADLKSGGTVLFSGTPCQIAGLKSYLGQDYNNLYTIDLICHGVPGESLFNQYLNFLNRKYKGEVQQFLFRDKSRGWKLFGKMVLKKGNISTEVHFEPEQSSYYQLFLNRCTYRDSCYVCPYAGKYRPGDITIGDYWCVELAHPELIKENGGHLEYQKGCSVLIINNDRGKQLIEQYGTGINKWKSDYKKAARYNNQLLKPSERPKERDIVFQLCQKNYVHLERWYKRKQWPVRLKKRVKRMIPKKIKAMIKNSIRI